MQHKLHSPSLSCSENIGLLPNRNSPYWNILEYCRHIGLEKLPDGRRHWMARVRCRSGKYKQTRLGLVGLFDQGGLTYEDALTAANQWFRLPEIQAEASEPYAVGGTTRLNYVKSKEGFTIGDALQDFVEWKRVSAAKTYFATSLSLINHHIVPRLGSVLVEEFTGRTFTDFCVDILESPPKRGRKTPGPRVRLEDLSHEALRKRKKTLNTVIGILRLALQMAWENGDIKSERTWRCIRRVPHADTPRQYFLTRSQAKQLLSACRSDLSKLVLAALYTGCRVSELAMLRVRDVGGHVFGVYVAPMKSYRGRYVFLPDEGMSFMLDQIDGKDEEDLVFRMSSGKAWTGCHKHLFKDAVRRAGLPEAFVFHGLRHTYASQLVQAGTPLAVVARQLGHSNTDTVSRTYGHLCCETIEKELSRRFAPLRRVRNDTRLKKLRASLQTDEVPIWSWPVSNRSKASGTLVSLLRAREDELRS
ncbi:Phage integrase family protein [Litoreibacter janthinus]|uniref:Phage integrase family protein n=2 Tax=Litoreibacter janthinus TaxID=670154 RepID=A0A1I6FSA1_9RHOB|nr:Phage integrase family protein [Litoreibacter janthinus]